MMHVRVVLGEHTVGGFGVEPEGAAEILFDPLQDVISVWAAVSVNVMDLIGGALYPEDQGVEKEVVSLRLRTPDADAIVDLL